MGQYILKNASNTQFYFRLQAGNNEPILTSETYPAKASALGGIAAVRTNAPLDARYERKFAANGQFMFNLKGGNGERIGTSETYATEAAREKGIESVKTNAPGATVDDQT